MSAAGRLEQNPIPIQGIDKIDAYVPGESALPGSGPIIKLSSNETPLGPSPKAIEAFKEIAGKLELYPDGTAKQLREAIANRYGLKAERIVCGAGSDELLNLLANAYLNIGDEAIYTEHGFLVYKIAIMANGATPVVVPEKDLTADVDAILSAVTERTKMVFLANPNNPTGTYVPFDKVRRLREKLPSHVLLVLDGAYAEYVRRNDYEVGIELVATTDNTVMTRTFSKIYGLANLRLGWAYCPEPIAEVLNKIRGPFNVAGPSIAAGAAAINDQSHIDQAVEHNEQWSAWLSNEIAALGLSVTPSVGNFLLIHFPTQPGKTAEEADKFLQSKRIIIRRVSSYGLPNALRMTIGDKAQNETVIAALKEFMSGDD